ncbi:MAG: hypothetical protein H0W48_00250 [Methylibium sp.]|nr:hypothetical protein [Methylibium sp.]
MSANKNQKTDVFTISDGEWQVRIGDAVLPTIWNSKGAALAGLKTECLRRAAPELLAALQETSESNAALREALDDAIEALIDKSPMVNALAKVSRASLPVGMRARASINKATGGAQ